MTTFVSQPVYRRRAYEYSLIDRDGVVVGTGTFTTNRDGDTWLLTQTYTDIDGVPVDESRVVVDAVTLQPRSTERVIVRDRETEVVTGTYETDVEGSRTVQTRSFTHSRTWRARTTIEQRGTTTRPVLLCPGARSPSKRASTCATPRSTPRGRAYGNIVQSTASAGRRRSASRRDTVWCFQVSRRGRSRVGHVIHHTEDGGFDKRAAVLAEVGAGLPNATARSRRSPAPICGRVQGRGPGYSAPRLPFEVLSSRSQPCIERRNCARFLEPRIPDNDEGGLLRRRASFNRVLSDVGAGELCRQDETLWA